MACFNRRHNVVEKRAGHGHGSLFLLGEDQGCRSGCCAGISYYRSLEYTPPATHDDQEGFFILSGEGWAHVGNEEFEVEPGMAFLVPARTVHQLKSINEERALEVFWFHAKS